jgi:hypothetical protein
MRDERRDRPDDERRRDGRESDQEELGLQHHARVLLAPSGARRHDPPHLQLVGRRP